MSRVYKFCASVLLALGAAVTAHAFSLTGPSAAHPWQTDRLGYDTGLAERGPMNLGEEYRWNVKELYWGITPDFYNYFGQRGAQEMEKAIAFLNELPSMDDVKDFDDVLDANDLSLDDYPMSALRVNHRATALGVVDLRSATLSTLLNDLGLDTPSRYVFTLRNRWITPPNGPTNYFVIKRNFDPVTWQPSSYINGVLWTYNAVLDGDTSAIIPEPVDPLALGGILNIPVADGYRLVGSFWTGLTRDDIGGLRYIYRGNNYNVETTPVNVFGSALGGGSSGSPWGSVTLPGNGTVIPGATTNFVNQAVRGGIGKVSFIRVGNNENIFGAYRSNTVSFTDSYVVGAGAQTQPLVRPMSRPDFLFDAADITGPIDTAPNIPNAPGSMFIIVNGSGFINNDEINGEGGSDRPDIGAPAPNGGPGTMTPHVATADPIAARLYVYNNVGPIIWNSFPNPQGFNSEVDNVSDQYSGMVVWGSFDGSADEPFVYPHRSTIEEVEARVLSGDFGDDSGSPGPSTLLSPWGVVVLPAPVDTTGGGTVDTGETP